MLTLDNNIISNIHHESFTGLTNLKTLTLDHNNISEIHPKLFTWLNRSLETLTLDHNIIFELHPKQFTGLINLKTLTLDHNNISEIHPDQFTGLTNLITLTLDDVDNITKSATSMGTKISCTESVIMFSVVLTSFFSRWSLSCWASNHVIYTCL